MSKIVKQEKNKYANNLIEFYNGYKSNIFIDSRKMETNFNSAVQQGHNFLNSPDKVKLITHIAYADIAGKVSECVNNFTMLQDMLVYAPLEVAKSNLRAVFNPKYVEVEKNKIPGKHYAINGHSPIFFDIPLITSQGYRTSAVMISVRIINAKFIDLLETIDIDCFNEKDMEILAKDFSLIGRLSELAIDSAKDNKLEMIDAHNWVDKANVVVTGNWLNSKNNKWEMAKDNLQSMINSRLKRKNTKEKFKIELDEESKAYAKYSNKTKIDTSSCIMREALLETCVNEMNSQGSYSYLLDMANESDLLRHAQTIKHDHSRFKQVLNKETGKMEQVEEAVSLTKEISAICNMYKSYSYSLSLTDVTGLDEEALADLNYANKLKKEKLAASVRNTLLHVQQTSGVKWSDICYIIIAYFLESKNGELKNNDADIKAIIPTEYAILYSGKPYLEEKKEVEIEDEFTEEMLDEGHEIKVKFVNGIGYDESDIVVAKTNYKYNAEEAVLKFDEETQEYVSIIRQKFTAPTIDPNVPLVALVTSEGDVDSKGKVIPGTKKPLFFANDVLGQELDFVTSRPKKNKQTGEIEVNSFTKKAEIRSNVVAKTVNYDGTPKQLLAAQLKLHTYTSLSLCNKMLIKLFKDKPVQELKDKLDDYTKPLAGKIVIHDTLKIETKNKDNTINTSLLAFITIAN